jgi:hypothetical protein
MKHENVVIKENARTAARIERIVVEPSALARIIGGPVERQSGGGDLMIACHAFGRYAGLADNVQGLVGPIIIYKTGSEGLSDAEAQDIMCALEASA